MDNREYLLRQIGDCKRKLNIAKGIDCGIAAAAAGGCAGILLETASLFWRFYYVHAAAGLCFAAGFAAGILYAFCRRADMRRAAGRLDAYGLRERILTAYEQIEAGADLADADEFVRMQREDAVLHYNQIRDKIKISLMPDKKHVLALVLSLAAAVLLRFVPSPVRDEAQLQHQVQVQAKEEKEELEELIDALEAVDMEKLTEEQRARLQELSEALKLSAQELAKADSWESLASAAERLDYKYRQAESGLRQLASQLGDMQSAGIADALALAKAAADSDGQQMASAGAAASAGSSASDKTQGGEDGGDGSGGSQGDGSDGSQGDGSEDSQGDGAGSGQGDGAGSGQGDGSGGSQGDGSGGGQGDGSDGGQGGGSDGSQDGSGSGRGTGSSSSARDYVSIPNAVANDSSLTGNQYGDENSDYFRQQNGLAWEGEHVEYNSVVGEYAQNAYEGIANGRYPSGMESVIRNYFENLNK